jgi:2-polyprenyl-6-methoxyphenol hydroxylase-like FAD-dependent oxidoreductase
MEKPVDVVVVGAGPVGLLTAIELTLAGVRVLVLERLAAASMAMKAGGDRTDWNRGVTASRDGRSHRRRRGAQLRSDQEVH